LNKDYRIGWKYLKKLSKPSFSNSQPSSSVKDINGNFLYSDSDQLSRWTEHYELLASDVNGHSLDKNFRDNALSNYPKSNLDWDINYPITLSEIQDTVLSMNNNKAPGPDGIPTEFYKTFISENSESTSGSSPAAKCLEIIFNKIWNGSFPSSWSSESIVSISKKGDLSDCNNYRGISLINVGLKIISKIFTKKITIYALSHKW